MFKFDIVARVLLIINVLIGIIMYFILPDRIAIQWTGKEVSSMVGKIYILLLPSISVLLLVAGKVLMRWVMYKWFRKSNEIMTSYLNMFLQIILFTCQLYIVLFTYGFRLTISTILIIELFIGSIIGLKLRHKLN